MIENDKVIFEKKIDSIFSDVVRTINPSISQYCKNFFEKNLLTPYGSKLELTLIIDANAVISDVLSYIKNNKSYLLTLSNSHFLKMLAPSWLKIELEKKVPEVSKNQKIDENYFRSVVLMFLEKIKLIDITDDLTYRIALSKIGERDRKDIPYIALYFSIKSNGILTKDKDITEVSDIKTWERPGIPGKVVSIFEKGALSFTFIGETLPSIFRFLYETCVIILKNIWEIIKMIGNAIASLVKEAIATFSKFPDWIQVFIGIGAILLLLLDKSQEVIIKFLQDLKQRIVDILKWLYENIKNILNSIEPLLEIGLTILTFLSKKIEETIDAYKQLNSQSEG